MEDLFSLIESWPLYARMAVSLGLALLLGGLINVVLYSILRATAKRTKSFSLQKYVEETRNVFFAMLALFLSVIFWSGLESTNENADVAFYFLPAIRIARTLGYIFLGLYLVRLTNVGAASIRHRYNADDQNNLRERKILTQLQYIQRIVIIIIFVVMVAFVLLQFDEMKQIGRGILTSAGVSGIIIGFAAQKSIANLLAGFQIAFTQPIRLDDALIVNGEYGWVEEINLTYVTMRLWDQRRQIIPLQFFIDNTFQNWTRTNSELIGTVLLHVDYTFPVQALREELDRWLPEQDIWDERVKSVMVTDNNDRAMTVRVLVSAKDAGTTFDLRCRTREYLINWVQQNYRESLPQSRVASDKKKEAMVDDEIQQDEDV